VAAAEVSTGGGGFHGGGGVSTAVALPWRRPSMAAGFMARISAVDRNDFGIAAAIVMTFGAAAGLAGGRRSGIGCPVLL